MIIIIVAVISHFPIKWLLTLISCTWHRTHTLRNAGKKNQQEFRKKKIYSETSFSEESSVLTDFATIK